MDRLRYVFNLTIVAILFGAVALNKSGRILGHTTQELFNSSPSVEVSSAPVETMEWDGTRVISSASLARDVVGFAGRTPITLRLKDGVVVGVEAEPNEETPSFFRRLINQGLMDSWNGYTLAEAMDKRCDVISGATYSSVAVIENVHRAMAYAASVDAVKQRQFNIFDIKSIAGLVTILLGILLTFFRPRRKIYEVAYMLLNVAVLGFWCASFLSLAQVVSWMSNGFSFSLTLMLLMVVIFVPIFGRKGSYCHLHCPMGSAQELISRLPTPQLKFSAKVNSVLNKLRYCILVIVLMLMWIGVGFEIMDYEVFSVFLLSSASNVVLVLAAIFLFLSFFIKRPYCRFVCPTGALLTTLQKTKG